MSKIFSLTLFIFLSGFNLLSQNTLNGHLSAVHNQWVRLIGFSGFEIYTIDSVKSSVNGDFSFNYTENDYGMAYLTTEDNISFILILGNELLQISGESLANPETIHIQDSPENLLFGKYAIEHPRREQALSAWEYLMKLYQNDSLFANQIRPAMEIERERIRIKDEDQKFLQKLDPTRYVSWYLPIRKLVSSVGTVAQYRTNEIPVTIEDFRKLDYTDNRLYKSGLLREAIEAHFWLIENSGRSLDSVYLEMNISIDRMIEYLVKDEQKFNEITAYLFKMLEKRSLFSSSEYLAVKVLNLQSCTLNSDLAAQLESYRAMKKGNIASEILLEGEILSKNQTAVKESSKLSDFQSQFTLLVFGASWCPACTSELAQISTLYSRWKAQGVEVLFISLDEEPAIFRQFAENFPFKSLCDYKKWDSPNVKNYYVFATPTMFLVDSQRKILLKPNSAKHMDSWVDWFLIQGHY